MNNNWSLFQISLHLSNISESGRGAFAISRAYVTWETDEVIAAELYRNIGLAIAAVSLTTLFLLSDLVASFLVLGCGLTGLFSAIHAVCFNWDRLLGTISKFW